MNESRLSDSLFSLSLCAVFCYVWELYRDLVFPRSRDSSSSSVSTVCRSKSGSLCAPGFSLGLQGHLVKTEKRKPIVLDTDTQNIFSTAGQRNKTYCISKKRKKKMVYLSNPNLSLPCVNALPQLLVFALDVHILHDIRSLIICHLAAQVLVEGLCL